MKWRFIAKNAIGSRTTRKARKIHVRVAIWRPVSLALLLRSWWTIAVYENAPHYHYALSKASNSSGETGLESKYPCA